MSMSNGFKKDNKVILNLHHLNQLTKFEDDYDP